MSLERWSQKDITKWAVQTFGEPATAEVILERLNEEFIELLNSYLDMKQGLPNKIKDEIADVSILLAQFAEHLDIDVNTAVDEKMQVNSTRSWSTSGNGVGQHV